MVPAGEGRPILQAPLGSAARAVSGGAGGVVVSTGDVATGDVSTGDVSVDVVSVDVVSVGDVSTGATAVSIGPVGMVSVATVSVATVSGADVSGAAADSGVVEGAADWFDEDEHDAVNTTAATIAMHEREYERMHERTRCVIDATLRAGWGSGPLTAPR
jgi:hypothetical protein